MPGNPRDWDDLDDFDPDDDDDDDYDEEDDIDDWSVEEWEEDMKRREEQDRKLVELLDKYGHDSAGFRKAMTELGYGEFYEEMDRLEAELANHPELAEEEEDDEEPVDKVLRESRYATEDSRKDEFRHSLGSAAHELTMMVLNSTKGHDEIDSREHPLVLHSNAFLDAQGGIARMSYMRRWNDESDWTPPKNMRIAELKRVVKNLVLGISRLEKVEQQNLLAPEICEPIRQQAVVVLDEVRRELRRLGWK